MTFNDTSYNYLLRRPTHQLNATVGWNITKALFASINGRYVSDRYDVGGYKKADVKMDGYFLLGGYMEYSLPKNSRLFADFQNITNKDFVETVGFNTIPFMVHAGFTFSL
jgi:vitamin B12 transporter